MFSLLSFESVKFTNLELMENEELSGSSFISDCSTMVSTSSDISVGSEGPSNSIYGDVEMFLRNSDCQYALFIAMETNTELAKTEIPHTLCCKGCFPNVPIYLKLNSVIPPIPLPWAWMHKKLDHYLLKGISFEISV